MTSVLTAPEVAGAEAAVTVCKLVLVLLLEPDASASSLLTCTP